MYRTSVYGLQINDSAARLTDYKLWTKFSVNLNFILLSRLPTTPLMTSFIAMYVCVCVWCANFQWTATEWLYFIAKFAWIWLKNVYGTQLQSLCVACTCNCSPTFIANIKWIVCCDQVVALLYFCSFNGKTTKTIKTHIKLWKQRASVWCHSRNIELKKRHGEKEGRNKRRTWSCVNKYSFIRLLRPGFCSASFTGGNA